MDLLRKKIVVKPNQIGYLYRNYKLQKKLEPGIYKFFAPWSELTLITLPTTEKLIAVTNQEVLTQDNIALRFSYFVLYRISEGDRFITKFDVFQNPNYLLYEAEQLIHNLTQVYLREAIAKMTSEELNERRQELLQHIPAGLQSRLADYGLVLQELMLRDLTFPRTIQDLFARRLEAKIRARSDLENARTAVATVRALKNASELMQDDNNIRFIQFLETITKIAATGKHTFVIGEMNQNYSP